MINFIICDDNEFFLMEIYNIINDFCLSKKINFKIYAFNNYGSEFYDIMRKELDNKVYILDIEHLMEMELTWLKRLEIKI